MAMKLNLPGGSSVTLSKEKVRIKPHGSYVLTEQGKYKCEQGGLTGNRGRVLGAVDSLSDGEPTQIANEAGLSPEQTRRILKELIITGYVRQEHGGS